MKLNTANILTLIGLVGVVGAAYADLSGDVKLNQQRSETNRTLLIDIDNKVTHMEEVIVQNQTTLTHMNSTLNKLLDLQLNRGN